MLRLGPNTVPMLGAFRPVCYRQCLPKTRPAGPIAGSSNVSGADGMALTNKPASSGEASRFFEASLAEADREIADAIQLELGRQRDEIELIASENIVSRAVLEAQGSVLTNKYAEGLPGK